LKQWKSFFQYSTTVSFHVLSYIHCQHESIGWVHPR
jgi:hypothetical protein